MLKDHFGAHKGLMTNWPHHNGLLVRSRSGANRNASRRKGGRTLASWFCCFPVSFNLLFPQTTSRHPLSLWKGHLPVSVAARFARGENWLGNIPSSFHLRIHPSSLTPPRTTF